MYFNNFAETGFISEALSTNRVISLYNIHHDTHIPVFLRLILSSQVTFSPMGKCCYRGCCY